MEEHVDGNQLHDHIVFTQIPVVKMLDPKRCSVFEIIPETGYPKFFGVLLRNIWIVYVMILEHVFVV